MYSRRPGPTQRDIFSHLLPARTPGSMGINDAGDPSADAEIGDTAGSLGMNDSAEWYLSALSGRRTKGKQPRTGSAPVVAPPAAGGELNIYGSFKEGPWKTNAEVLAAIRSMTDEWFPGSAELREFAKSGKGTVEGVVNVWNVLCSIARNRPNRVNIFTHATSGYIGLSGKVVKGNVYFSAKADAELNDEIINSAEEDDFTFSDSKSKNVTMKQVRAALRKDAEIVIYACHSGLDKTYLQKRHPLPSGRQPGREKHQVAVQPRELTKGVRLSSTTARHHCFALIECRLLSIRFQAPNHLTVPLYPFTERFGLAPAQTTNERAFSVCCKLFSPLWTSIQCPASPSSNAGTTTPNSPSSYGRRCS